MIFFILLSYFNDFRKDLLYFVQILGVGTTCKSMATTIMLHNRYLKGQPTAEEIYYILSAYYAGQKLISVRWGGDGPMLPANALAGTDRLELVVCGHEDQTIVTALFDNLGKGASGAAVQNMNIMLGLDETTGLNLG